jgi:hypothetical protein
MASFLLKTVISGFRLSELLELKNLIAAIKKELLVSRPRLIKGSERVCVCVRERERQRERERVCMCVRER